MNVRAQRVFVPTLREVERGLALPIPERLQILRELEYDLQELWGRLVEEGLSQEEARRRALEALVPDTGALGELGRLHTPLYRRWTRNLTAAHLKIAERSALVLATTSVLLAQTITMLRADLLRDPSPFMWPVLAAGALLFALVVAKSFQLWIKGDHGHPERGLGTILALSGMILAMGIGGMIFDLYRLAGVLERAPELAGSLTPVWLVRDSALLSVSIILALAGGLVWLVLSQWVALVSGARRELLGLNVSFHPQGEGKNV
jgi:hypothetical protein